jgi:Zn finger protein HypA/HybF involved in hydrogenase expression
MSTKTDLKLKYLKLQTRTKTRLWCNECERGFQKVLGAHTIEVECPNCGSFDTEPA